MNVTILFQDDEYIEIIPPKVEDPGDLSDLQQPFWYLEFFQKQCEEFRGLDGGLRVKFLQISTNKNWVSLERDTPSPKHG